MIARGGLVVLALAALAFLIPQLLEERDLRQARSLGTDLAALTKLRDARAHTISGEPRLREAQFLLFTQRPEAALAVIEPLTRREPEHLAAWQALAVAARMSGDLTLQAEARERLAELNPRASR